MPLFTHYGSPFPYIHPHNNLSTTGAFNPIGDAAEIGTNFDIFNSFVMGKVSNWCLHRLTTNRERAGGGEEII